MQQRFQGTCKEPLILAVWSIDIDRSQGFIAKSRDVAGRVRRLSRVAVLDADYAYFSWLYASGVIFPSVLTLLYLFLFQQSGSKPKENKKSKSTKARQQQKEGSADSVGWGLPLTHILPVSICILPRR